MLTRSKIALNEHMKSKKTNWRLPLIAAVFGLTVGTAHALHLTINVSESMKEGVYIGAGHIIHRGDTVAVCLDKNVAKVGLKQGYVLRGNACDGGTSPLIKQVLAIPGDNLVLTDTNIRVNDHSYPYVTFHTDTQGREISSIPRGNYSAIKRYFLIGTNAQNSWDSRYWGQVNQDQILYRLVPVWTFS